MRNGKKNKLVFRIGLLLIILIAVLAKPIYTLITNQESWSKEELLEYKKLFKNNEWENLRLFNTIHSKTREPESQYIYKNSFNVFVTKIQSSDTLNLTKVIVMENQASALEMNEVYFSIRSFDCKIHIKSGKIPLVNNVELQIESPEVAIVAVSTGKASYFFSFKTFSLMFNKSFSYVMAESKGPGIPAAITFLKKGDLLYVLLMTPANRNIEMRPDQLISTLNQ